MIKSVWLIVVGAMSLMSVTVPSGVFAATVNCDFAVQTCVGTTGADTMIISKLKGGPGFYFIDPKGGDDTIVANVVQKDPGISGFVTSPSGGNDKISVKNPIAIGTIEFYGGDGSDTITYNGTPGVKLFQAEFHNNPDGDKDTLNCGNAGNSVAHIILEDGDVPVNCNTVNSEPNPYEFSHL
jgi:hypothetical protein